MFDLIAEKFLGRERKTKAFAVDTLDFFDSPYFSQQSNRQYFLAWLLEMA